MAKPSKAPRWLTHERVWTALDRLAARAGMSPSGLARRAGLDPTTFNKSKRVTSDGRQRWPSTGSVAKALAATDASIDIFVQSFGYGEQQAASVPLVTMAETAQRGHFDEHGVPFGKRRRRIALPSADGAFALEISGTHMSRLIGTATSCCSRATAIQRAHRVAAARITSRNPAPSGPESA